MTSVTNGHEFEKDLGVGDGQGSLGAAVHRDAKSRSQLNEHYIYCCPPIPHAQIRTCDKLKLVTVKNNLALMCYTLDMIYFYIFTLFK